MRFRSAKLLGTLVLLISVAIALCCWSASPALAQDGPEVYTATVIASEGLAGSTGRISIRIVAYTPETEKTSLLAAFKKDPQAGMALLRSMSKGYINIEGQPGRKIEAVFTRPRQDGRDLIVIGEHVASRLEDWEGVKAEDHPVAVIHLRLAADGTPVGGEIFPAVKLAVTPDGFVDVQTDASNKITMINLARQ
ncbi:MAG TPA: hypothetical protein VE825_09995 [Terriglobales bacterium]|jgi:hypothetical protein|nr:hypothetical protein [Terriglobales bacterium]